MPPVTPNAIFIMAYDLFDARRHANDLRRQLRRKRAMLTFENVSTSTTFLGYARLLIDVVNDFEGRGFPLHLVGLQLEFGDAGWFRNDCVDQRACTGLQLASAASGDKNVTVIAIESVI